MRFKNCFLYFSLVVAFSTSPLLVSAQEESEIPGSNRLMYGILKVVDQEISVLYMELVPEQRERTLTVEVPVTRTVQVEGREETRTEMRTEERTESYTVMVDHLTTHLLEPGSVKFQTISGTSVSFDQLSNYNDKPLLMMTDPAATVNQYMKQMFHAETLVVIPVESHEGGR